jgi:hypothetical protein
MIAEVVGANNAAMSRASEFGCEFGWPRARGGCLGGLAPGQITSKLVILGVILQLGQKQPGSPLVVLGLKGYL